MSFREQGVIGMVVNSAANYSGGDMELESSINVCPLLKCTSGNTFNPLDSEMLFRRDCNYIWSDRTVYRIIETRNIRGAFYDCCSIINDSQCGSCPCYINDYTSSISRSKLIFSLY